METSDFKLRMQQFQSDMQARMTSMQTDAELRLAELAKEMETIYTSFPALRPRMVRTRCRTTWVRTNKPHWTKLPENAARVEANLRRMQEGLQRKLAKTA